MLIYIYFKIYENLVFTNFSAKNYRGKQNDTSKLKFLMIKRLVKHVPKYSIGLIITQDKITNIRKTVESNPI